jgi:hypothetical protein
MRTATDLAFPFELPGHGSLHAAISANYWQDMRSFRTHARGHVGPVFLRQELMAMSVYWKKLSELEVDKNAEDSTHTISLLLHRLPSLRELSLRRSSKFRPDVISAWQCDDFTEKKHWLTQCHTHANIQRLRGELDIAMLDDEFCLPQLIELGVERIARSTYQSDMSNFFRGGLRRLVFAGIPQLDCTRNSFKRSFSDLRELSLIRLRRFNHISLKYVLQSTLQIRKLTIRDCEAADLECLVVASTWGQSLEEINFLPTEIADNERLGAVLAQTLPSFRRLTSMRHSAIDRLQMRTILLIWEEDIEQGRLADATFALFNGSERTPWNFDLSESENLPKAAKNISFA